MSEEIKIAATLNVEVLAALDGWIKDQPEPKLTREQAVTLAVCEWLAVQRRLAPAACEDAA